MQGMDFRYNTKINKNREKKIDDFFELFFDDIFEKPKIFENHDFSSKKSLFSMRKPMIFVLCLNIIPSKFQGATPHIGGTDVLFVLDPPDFGES